MTDDQTRDRVADKLLGMKRYRCDNCDFATDDYEELDPISKVWDRVIAGEVMPDGECPKCGSLIGPDDETLIDSGALSWMPDFLHRQGYTVIEPKT